MFLFILRRKLFIFVVLFLEEVPVIQIALVVSSSYVAVLYLIKAVPFKDKLVNWIELFNEAVILALCYLMWSFTDYQDDAKVKFKVGWAYSFIIIFFVFTNILIFVYSGVEVSLNKMRSKRKKKVKK